MTCLCGILYTTVYGIWIIQIVRFSLLHAWIAWSCKSPESTLPATQLSLYPYTNRVMARQKFSTAGKLMWSPGARIRLLKLSRSYLKIGLCIQWKYFLFAVEVDSLSSNSVCALEAASSEKISHGASHYLTCVHPRQNIVSSTSSPDNGQLLSSYMYKHARQLVFLHVRSSQDTQQHDLEPRAEQVGWSIQVICHLSSLL